MHPEDDFQPRPAETRPKPPEAPALLDAAYPETASEDGAAEPSDASRRKKRNTARLVWDSKPKKAPNPKNLGFQIAEVVVPNPASQSGPRLPFDAGTQEVDTTACNRLIWGDNLLVMQALLSQGYEGKINLIYIDPPFDSKADYSHTVQLTPDGSGKGGGELNAEMSALERLAYRDTWEDGTDSYLDMLYPRLQLMHRLLAENGSILVHCDWHVQSQIRLLLDEIFGRAGFRADVAWKRQTSSGYKGKTSIGRNHERILYYAKTDMAKFNAIYIPYSEGYVDQRFCHMENNGRRFKDAFLGTATTVETIERLKAEDKIFYTSRGGMRLKVYLDEAPGVPLDDFWADINAVNSQAMEDCNYDTQKPEELLSRIVGLTTDPGDLVADFFCGSGTTAAVAEKLGRRWITSDLGKASLQVARNRFVKMGEAGSGGIGFQRPDGATRCAPFVVENLGNYQRQLIYLNGYKNQLGRVGGLVLTLFGALPHPAERNLGTQAFNDPVSGRLQRRLVLVGEPDRPLSAKRVAEAVRLLGSLDGGGYTKLVALGWDYELNFDASLQRLLGRDIDKVEARIVPTDVIEHLRKIPDGAGPEDAAVERLREKVAFFEKAWLEAPVFEVLGRVEVGGERQLKVRLKLGRYLLRSVPSGLKGFEKMSEGEKRDWLLRAGGADGLSLIDFWSVDDDLGGEDGKRPFTSGWQDLRGLGKRVRRVVTGTELIYAPRPGRQVGLRMVDVFGNDAAWRGLLPEG